MRTTSRSITAQVKKEGTFLNVGESETAMLYEIREVNGKFKLFFHKKNGLKFKKSFVLHKREWVENDAEAYLRLCCLRCKERGWVYKTRGSGGIHGGGASHGKGNRGLPHWGSPATGSQAFCPECRAKHIVGYEDVEFQGIEYSSDGHRIVTYMVPQIVLMLCPDD